MASIEAVHFPSTLNQQLACGRTSHTYLLLVLIHTSLRNYDRREASRETWAARKALDESVVVLYFVSGDAESGNLPAYKDTLTRENNLHQDIIYTNFTHNDKFTRILVSSTMWITKFCPHVSYVLNIADSTVVDLNKLVPFLNSIHLQRPPYFICDYLMPNESTVLNNLPKRDKSYCSKSAFLTTPSVIKELTSVLKNNQDRLKGSLLSEICDFASVPITTDKRLFTGTRKKPSMLKELMSPNYPNSYIMVALVYSQISGREAAIMRQAWHLIQSHHFQMSNKRQPPIDSAESGSILMFAIILMLIDFSVIFVIFALIFCKRRRKVQP